jgi:hypothetical protein
MIIMRWSQVGLGAVLVGVAAFFGNEKFRSKVSSVFGADGITPANLEEMHIESSGVTIDQVPTSLAQSFLGYQQLHLQGTNSIANDSPFMDGIVDAQPVYVNPHDIGYSFQPAEKGFSSEYVDEVGQTASSMNTTNNEFITGPGMPYTQTPSQDPVSLDPSTGAGVGITYDGSRLPVARLAPEVNRDFPYLVSMIDTPFLTPPSGDVGGNRIGSLARNSTDDNVNGRLGEVALSPDVDSSYLDTSTGRTLPLSQWRSTHTILRISDTMVSAIPFSGGFETQLRRV